MDDNSQKVPFGQSLNKFASEKALASIWETGRSLPCVVTNVMGAIVEVNFQISGKFTIPNVICPLATSQYTREPIQPGCKGYVVPGDVYLGGVSGLGGGVAGLSQPGNLAALVFHPIGNVAFPSADANTHTIFGGSNGISLQTLGASMTLSASGISLSSGGHTIVINASGVVIDGKVFLTHEHTGVTAGGGNTGPVL